MSWLNIDQLVVKSAPAASDLHQVRDEPRREGRAARPDRDRPTQLHRPADSDSFDCTNTACELVVGGGHRPALVGHRPRSRSDQPANPAAVVDSLISDCQLLADILVGQRDEDAVLSSTRPDLAGRSPA
jgi:hypothetical protein